MDTNSEVTSQVTTTPTATTITTTTTTPPVILPVKSTCANDGCHNPPVPLEDRGIRYCSNDCVVNHCRYVATYCGSKYKSLAVENLGRFGDLRLIHQRFIHQQFLSYLFCCTRQPIHQFCPP